MSSTDSQQDNSNELSIIFGTLASFLAILSVIIGIYQYRQLSRSSIREQDIEAQILAQKRVSSWTSLASTRSNASHEEYVPSIKAIEVPPPTYSSPFTKLQMRCDHARDIAAHQNLYAGFMGYGIPSYC